MPPAARVGDMHVCPMVTGVVPHVGGPILPPGCPTVLVGMMPAARVTDMATCVGPPDVIVKGSPTVLIGNLMAARIGDLTAHGGMIVLGCPTVIIGEVGVPTPTVASLQNNPTVQQALEQAWTDSQPNDPAHRHEEGGWIYINTTTGEITVLRQTPGQQAGIDLSNPPIVEGSVIVGKFHTHPNPTAEGWRPGPSDQDIAVDARHGVPDLIRADDGVYHSGPDSRRGGLEGGPGFPP